MAGKATSYELTVRAIGSGIFDCNITRSLVARIGADDGARRQMWEDLGSVVRDLAGEHPTPAMRLLARSGAVDWLTMQVYRAECEARERAGMSAAMGEHYQRRISRVHRRLLGTVKMIETVRRLRTPAATIRVRADVANLATQVNGVPPPAALAGS